MAVLANFQTLQPERDRMRAGVAELTAADPDHVVHLYRPGAECFAACEDYVTGDSVVEIDNADLVTCKDCREWVHA